MKQPLELWGSIPAEQDFFWFSIKICMDQVKTYYSDLTMSAMASQITSVSIVYSTVYSGADRRKHQRFHATGLCAGNSPVMSKIPGTKGQRENLFHLMTSSCDIIAWITSNSTWAYSIGNMAHLVLSLKSFPTTFCILIEERFINNTAPPLRVQSIFRDIHPTKIAASSWTWIVTTRSIDM